MSRVRFSKVRITDNRVAPPGAGAKPALERHAATRGGSVSGLEHLTASHAREAAEHDRAVRDYPPVLVEAAWNDLHGRRAYDRKDPEHRWVMARRAALGRLGLAMRKGGLA